MTKKYDITVYGATGFTGKQAAFRLSGLTQALDLRLAVAGRSREKLSALVSQLPERSVPVEILVADSSDVAALYELTKKSGLVVNLAGPFAKYAPELVSLCVENNCDYVDITGEPAFVHRMIQAHHASAQKNKVRVVPFCGFDSIPSDLGCFFILQEWRRRFQETGEECEEIVSLFKLKGGFNGGTVATAFEMIKNGDSAVLEQNLNLLSVSDKIPTAPDWKGPHWIKAKRGYSAPFFMAPVNTRVVRRSQSLFAQEESPAVFSKSNRFVYQEGLGWGHRFPFQGLLTSGVLGLINLSAKSKGLMSLGQKMAPKPGSGPSDKTMDSGFAKAVILARGRKGSLLEGSFFAEGDPGNRATIKMLCEAALCLALAGERRRLPEVYGVLTPAFAFRNVLLERLEKIGITFQIDE
ncbi:MAG: saccharopine dehydrogenase NADP-binding domain-containing protein [Deltaproteobacteria bacterium]|nr:saccharopine dehydrogenase NADP-binding domain-containing protein [Deltaproteobacteria bacterium]